MKPATYKDLVRIHKVSLNTINKALTGKSGISEKRRQQILKSAKKIGYRTNRLAHSLARKPIKIGIILPKIWPEYFNYIIKGLNNVFGRLRDFNVRGNFRWVSGLNAKEEVIEAMRSLTKEKVNAIIFYPIYGVGYEKYLAELNEKNIPVVVLGTDFHESNHLASVRGNAYLAGKLAAELMNYLVPENKQVAVFIGKKEFTDHREKLEGFMTESAHMSYKICRVLEAQDDPVIAYDLTKKLINEEPDLKGIYIATANSVQVCRCLCEHGLAGKVRIIATDVFPALKYYVDNDIVQCVIYQDQLKQAEIAVNVLYEYLTTRHKCERIIFISPQIVFKNNFENYLSALELGT
jgi:LacI family transcriptional regulator